MRVFRIISIFLLTCVSAVPTSGRAAGLAETISAVQPKVVKLFGAGGIRGLEGYQTGILISENGRILTAWSHVLDDAYLKAVLHDGRRYDASLVGADPQTGLAVLKIETTGLEFFDLTKAAEARSGTRVLAFSNAFGVAVGNEQASVQAGFVAAKTNLNARRGVWEAAYQGPVYILDAITSNPGAAGGALTDLEGRLVGMIGKELRNSHTHTWLNFALPARELAIVVNGIIEGDAAKMVVATDMLPERAFSLEAVGIFLLPRVLERTPPYIDRVKRGSVAQRLGLRPDDLIVLCQGTVIQSAEQLSEELEKIDARDPVSLAVMRRGKMVQFKLEMPQNPTEVKTP